MPTYSNVNRSKWLSMAGGTVDTVQFTKRRYRFAIVNAGSAATERVFVRFDETNPVVNSDDSHVVPAGGTRELAPPAGAKEVRLVSPGAPAVNVEALD